MDSIIATLPESTQKKIKPILKVVLVLLLLVVVVMCMQTAGYEKLSPLKVARVK